MADTSSATFAVTSFTIYFELFPTIPVTDVETYAKPVFEALDLPMGILDKTPYQISGGEHCTIALSLATSPDA